jgi:cell shape-determining protein MreD
MLTLIQRPTIRLIMVGMLLLTVQTTVFAEIRPWGSACDIMLGFSLASGVIGGPEKGALAGFVFGILVDLVIAAPFGLSALAYGLVAFLVGLIKSSITQGQAWWLTVGLVFSGSLLAVVAYNGFGTMVGQIGWFRWDMAKDAAIIATFNAIIGPVATLVQRWTLVLTREA